MANIVVKPGDLLILRTDYGEMTFTGGEYDFALQMAQRRADEGGRASLVAHLYRPKAKFIQSAVVIWPKTKRLSRQENLAIAA